MRRNREWLYINNTDLTAPLTSLLAKHITSCENVFLKGYSLLATYAVFRPIIHCNHHIKNLLKIGGV